MDGDSTESLEVILSPWEKEVFLDEKPQNPMSNLYTCPIRMDQKTFHSSEHMFCYLIAATYNQDKLCEKIKNNSDPLELQSLVNSFQEFNGKYDEVSYFPKIATGHRIYTGTLQSLWNT